MIITISSLLCIGGLLGAAVTMFVIGTKTYNDRLTFGGIGPLAVAFLLMAACCGSVGREPSLFEKICDDEVECCKACCKVMCTFKPKVKKSQQKVPVVPPISPETVTVSVQGRP